LAVLNNCLFFFFGTWTVLILYFVKESTDFVGHSLLIPADSPRELHHTQSPGKQQISFPTFSTDFYESMTGKWGVGGGGVRAV
jgi:hypothetical protein